MVKRKGFRVIQGGQSIDPTPAGSHLDPTESDALRERIRAYRATSRHAGSEDFKVLVNDLEDALDAFQKLMATADPLANQRAAEFRQIAYDIDAEIRDLINGGPPD